LTAITDFSPSSLVVSLGLDASEADPFGGLRLTTSGFARVWRAIGARALPTVLVQEGGYICPPLGDNLRCFLDGFEATHGRRNSLDQK
jgi:acetoin utilization deacetylase AcuC-like enzyme